MTDRDLRAYLLGQASEAQAARLEARLLDDDELFQILESVEDELFDDHARGRLNSADRQRFEARYGAHGERQRFAHAFAKRVDGAPDLAAIRPPSSQPRWIPMAAAAAMLILVGGLVLVRRPASAPTEARTPSTPRLTPAPEPRVAVFALALGASRAVASPETVTLRRETSALELRIRLNPADRYDSYQMDLRASATDTSVWHGDNLHAADARGDLVVVATVPATAVPDGAYELTVRGSRAGSPSPEDLGFVSVKVARTP